MENILQNNLPEIVFSSSHSTISRQISRLLKIGKLRKLSPRVYTSNFEDAPEFLIKRNLLYILGTLYPGSLLSHRSALELNADETIFLTYKYDKKIQLPGVTIKFIKGIGHVEGDTEPAKNLYMSSLERALLENMQQTQSKKSKVLPVNRVEERLERYINVHGADGLNKIRDKAKKISAVLDMKIEFIKLDRIISSMLSTAPSKILKSPVAKARALGEQYDPFRLELFQKLFNSLQNTDTKNIPEKSKSSGFYKMLSFYEAYFSNYIEGTEFMINEAKEIIFKNKILAKRPSDSHDILNTYKLVSDRNRMSRVPKTESELLELIKERHAFIMANHKGANAGLFKEETNRAGNTIFVQPQLVRGTLLKSFNLYNSIEDPLKRAIFIMFVISEVHPFTDGNGRLARIMMNSELVKEGKSKIIIPSSYREDYLLTLRQLSRAKEPDSYIEMLQKAQAFTSVIDFSNFESALSQLEKFNAFDTEGRLNWIQN
jgi:Fic family protein